MARRKPTESLSEQLRDAIRDELKGSSAYELAKEAGVDRSVLSRFLSGERTITLAVADRLAELLRLRLERRGR